MKSKSKITENLHLNNRLEIEWRQRQEEKRERERERKSEWEREREKGVRRMDKFVVTFSQKKTFRRERGSEPWHC